MIFSKNRRLIELLFLIFLFPGIVNAAEAKDSVEITFAGNIAWHSLHISEGRDNLDGDGIFTFEAVAQHQGITASTWLGVGEGDAFKELKIGLEYGVEWQAVDAYAGYTRLEFLTAQAGDNDTDNEFNVGIAFSELPLFSPALDYVYSTQAAGGFLEFSLRSNLEYWQGKLSLVPYALAGFDFGFASDTYRGINNLQLGADFSISISRTARVFANFHHSRGYKRIVEQGLGDHSWFTIGLSAEF